VIATPGRVLDLLMNSQSVHMELLEVVILDEADRLLAMGALEEKMLMWQAACAWLALDVHVCVPAEQSQSPRAALASPASHCAASSINAK
jgi:hypothetical protein